MKKILLIIALFFLSNCNKNDYVYWCGDHACINNKERISYFKKTMIVEIREENKQSANSKIEKKILLKEQRLEKKKLKEREKLLKKQAKLKKKSENKKMSKVKDKKSKKTVKLKKDDGKFIEEPKIVEKPIYSSTNDFNQILNAVIDKSKNKPFPDINNFPE